MKTVFKRPAVLVGALLLLCALFPTVGQAKAPIESFSLEASTTQAGGHPDLSMSLVIGNTWTQDIPAPDCRCHDVRNLTVDAPPGFIPNTHATPQCTVAEFGGSGCQIDAQIGTATVSLGAFGNYQYPIAVYNLVPHPNQPGLAGFYAPLLNSPIFIIPSSRTEGDYGLSIATREITHLIGVSGLDLTLWGVPADPSHDAMRFGPPGCDSQGTGGGVFCEGGNSSNSPLIPYLNNPTTCGVPLSATARTVAYDNEADSAEVSYPATTGCQQLGFNPSLYGQPTTGATDTSSGFDIDLKVPQGESPNVPASSQIKATTVTLPEGFSINANAADGKTSCSDSEAHFDSRELGAECPEFSKVGTLEVRSTSLPAPLPGFIYLRDPVPGNRYRILLAADGFGLHIKLPGAISADPASGRLITSFQNLPQFPFTEFNMHFFGSERGLLATPTHCGTYSVDSTFVPWDAVLPDQSSHQFFTLYSGPNGAPCPDIGRPFDPRMTAGVTDKTAGKHSSFILQLVRPDGDQNLRGLSVSTPPGFSATLAGIPYCPESAIARLSESTYSGAAELASPACPSASQIGTARVGVGAGSRPLYVTGKVYLAGSYKGAPLSLEVVVPAVSGPYDLGDVAVRATLDIDSTSAQVSAVSDPLPQIVGGVPLRMRSLVVNLNRDNFVLNPTNCDPFAIKASILGDEGAVASRSSHFQIANCVDLSFTPKLVLALTGGIARTGHPALSAKLTAKTGDANIAKTVVTLPSSVILDNAHINTPCTRVQFAANACPSGSVLGSAKAESPLLDRPLEGPVYLRTSSHQLPDLVASLHGQIDIELAGRIDTVNERLRTTFESVPDVPVSKFSLNLLGGKKGLLINSKALCGAPRQAAVVMRAHNGKSVKTATGLRLSCKSPPRKARTGRARHASLRSTGAVDR